MPSRKELSPRNIELESFPKPSFILLLGPSGVGKSTLINRLKLNLPIDYVTPVMDRPLREGEKDKTAVSKEKFTEMEANGEFIVVNNLYGYRYGAPKSRVDEILKNKRVPILDFPLDKVERLTKHKDILYTIYIVPPTLGTLRKRLDDDRRANRSVRFEAGKSELLKLVKAGFVHPEINEVVVNKSLEETVSKLSDLINTRIFS